MATIPNCGLVTSRRGPQGGHSLAMKPMDINLSTVMTALDASSAPLDCLSHPDDCVFSESCAQQEVWKSVEDAVHNLLSSITLADLARRQAEIIGSPMQFHPGNHHIRGNKKGRFRAPA